MNKLFVGLMLVMISLNALAEWKFNKTTENSVPHYDVNLQENSDGLMIKNNEPFNGTRTLFVNENEKLLSLNFSKGYLESRITYRNKRLDNCIKPCGIVRLELFHDAITLRDYEYGFKNYRQENKSDTKHIRYKVTVIDYDDDGAISSETLWINDNINGNCQIGNSPGRVCQ